MTCDHNPPQLLPCPFCGNDNVSTFGPYGWYRQFGISHSCSSFYSGSSEMFRGFPSEAHAIAAWNTRTAHTDELVEALEWLHLGKGSPVDIGAVLAKHRGASK